jgi:hypothetical protein
VPGDPVEWLRRHRHGTTADRALAFVDGLAPASVESLLGRWHGAGWHTGHPWDGLLEAYGWYGKEFRSADDVRPLLFRDHAGGPVAVSPGRIPLTVLRRAPHLGRHRAAAAAFRTVRPLLTTARPGGRLHLVEHRGTVTAALVYDAVPVLDVLRHVTPDLVVGIADIRDQPASLFFLLRRSHRAAS